MNKLTLFFLLTLFSCSQPSSEIQTSYELPKFPENPDIKLEIEALPEGEYVALVGSYLGENFLVDSTRVQANGLVHFKKEQPYPQGLVFALLEDDSAIEMLLTEDQTFSLKTSHSTLKNEMQVSGSLDNQLLYETREFELKNKKEITEIQKQLAENFGDKTSLETALWEKIDARFAYLENLKKSYPESFFVSFKTSAQSTDMRTYDRQAEKLTMKEYEYIFRNGYWDNVDFREVRLLSTPVISKKLDQYFNFLVSQESDSIILYGNALLEKTNQNPAFFQYFTNWMLLNYEPLKSNLMDSEAIYANLVEKHLTNENAFWIDSMQLFAFRQKAYAMTMSLLGKQGQDIIGKDAFGKTHSIYGQTSDYVLLYVFNPSCGLCKVETPKLVENYEYWKSLGVEILGIATDSDPKELKTYLKENQIEFPVILDADNVLLYPKYYVNRTPELYLLNAERKIIGKNLRSEIVESVIKFSEKEI